MGRVDADVMSRECSSIPSMPTSLHKRIATALGISIDTVKFHLKNAYAKLGVSNRTHAAERARALRLLP